MKTRKRILPDGWYPSTEKQIERTLSDWPAAEEGQRTGFSCIVPHAGWFFSGKLAFETISRLCPGVDTVVVVGGHLPAGGNVLAAGEEGYETPLGVLVADRQLMDEIEKDIPLSPDTQPDNTVEVLLPMVAWLFGESRALWLRAPQSETAAKAGRVIRDAAERIGRHVAVIGSTDLTHYGAGYGFMPKGRGSEALSWVKEENDGGIIRAFLDMDEENVLHYAVQRKAACSAGGALAALSFAQSQGIKKGELIRYLNSADVHPSDSFVGYAGIVYG